MHCELPFVFVTGMFRSGTTLLARMLNAHPRIAFASDPYSWIFKSFRNEAARSLFGAVDEDAPLGDYYFDADQQRLMRRLQAIRPATTPATCDRALLRQRVADKLRPFSPAIEPLLDGLDGETYGELLAGGLRLIHAAYGDEQTALVGFKEVWTNEFAPVVLDDFPQAKVICLVRDPRAVAASNNVTNAKYPWTFLARQWRKLAVFGWAQREHERFRLLKFEDLVREPRREMERLCAFLGIDFKERLVDPRCYVDGAGRPWQQNTNYDKGRRAFDPEAIDRWRERMTPEVQGYIETLCWPEMRAFGYVPEVASSGLVFASPRLNADALSEWIKPYSRLDDEMRERNAGLERQRFAALEPCANVPSQDRSRFFLSEAFFEASRQGAPAGASS